MGSLSATEASCQYYEGRAKDYAESVMYLPNKQAFEDVILGVVPGHFFWFEYPTHSEFFGAANSSLNAIKVSTPRHPASIIPANYPDFPYISILRASYVYDSINFVYGWYVVPVSAKTGDIDHYKTTCINHPTEVQLRMYILRNKTHIHNIPVERNAYKARTKIKPSTPSAKLSRPASLDLSGPSRNAFPKPVLVQPDVQSHSGESSESIEAVLLAAKKAQVKRFFAFEF